MNEKKPATYASTRRTTARHVRKACGDLDVALR